MTDLTKRDTHFEFGANWAQFANSVDAKKIDIAVEGLRKLIPDLAGKSFIDIGSGSGLSSLAALRLGASSVYAVDIDENSVATTRALLSEHAPDGPWHSEQVSVFDLSAEKHGTFDIVHSWGVLHHTGSMWKAISNAATLTKPGGQFALAIYTKTKMCSFWRIEKKFYTKMPTPVQSGIRGAYASAFLLRQAILGINPISFVKNYQDRGMRWSNDVHDWLGGYPYESASGVDMESFLSNLGLQKVRSFCQESSFGLFGSGCSEYVFKKN